MSSDISKELAAQYSVLQRTRGVRTSLEQLDSAFYISDGVLSLGYVSTFLSQQLCARIADIFMNWNGYLHGLIMPDAHHLVQMNESKVFSAEEKKSILALIGSSMEFVSRNMLFHAQSDPSAEARFIDEAFAFWESSYKPSLVSFIEKLRVRWSS